MSRTAIVSIALLSLLAAAPSVASACEAVPGYRNYWLSPSGSDSNIGNRQAPMRTLQALHDRIDAPSARGIWVHVAGGVYHATDDAVAVTWSKTTENAEVRIVACPGELPTFDGLESEEDDIPQSRFLAIGSPANARSNVTIIGLRIRNYWQNGVVLNRSPQLGWNGGNSIRRCTFERIGNRWWPSLGPGFAALNVQRSRDNIIADNRFVEVENTDASGELIHAVYFAHEASGNQVLRSIVVSCSGDPFKVRDASNDNVFRDNLIAFSGYRAVVNAWYRGSGEERPSAGSTIQRNTVLGHYYDRDELEEPLALCVARPQEECSLRNAGDGSELRQNVMRPATTR